jgi:hypothetical protein
VKAVINNVKAINGSSVCNISINMTILWPGVAWLYVKASWPRLKAMACEKAMASYRSNAVMAGWLQHAAGYPVSNGVICGF